MNFLFLLSIGIKVSSQTTGVILQEIRELNLSGVTITEIQDIPAGNFTPQGRKTIANFPATLRVAFTAKPTPEFSVCP